MLIPGCFRSFGRIRVRIRLLFLRIFCIVCIFVYIVSIIFFAAGCLCGKYVYILFSGRFFSSSFLFSFVQIRAHCSMRPDSFVGFSAILLEQIRAHYVVFSAAFGRFFLIILGQIRVHILFSFSSFYEQIRARSTVPPRLRPARPPPFFFFFFVLFRAHVNELLPFTASADGCSWRPGYRHCTTSSATTNKLRLLSLSLPLF